MISDAAATSSGCSGGSQCSLGMGFREGRLEEVGFCSKLQSAKGQGGGHHGQRVEWTGR